MDGVFVAVDNGLYNGHLSGLPLHGVELREAYKSGPSERLLFAFTRAFLDDHVLRALSPDYVRTLSDATSAAIRARIGQ